MVKNLLSKPTTERKCFKSLSKYGHVHCTVLCTLYSIMYTVHCTVLCTRVHLGRILSFPLTSCLKIIYSWLIRVSPDQRTHKWAPPLHIKTGPTHRSVSKLETGKTKFRYIFIQIQRTCMYFILLNNYLCSTTYYMHCNFKFWKIGLPYYAVLYLLPYTRS